MHTGNARTSQPQQEAGQNREQPIARVGLIALNQATAACRAQT
jgi:hypothetical protein